MASGELSRRSSQGLFSKWSSGDPLFWNKVSGAVLGALLLGVGLNIFSDILYTPKKPATPGYDLPAPEAESGGGASDQQAQAEPLPVLLASADPGRGQSAAKKCAACHVFEKGGPNKIGPNLYSVVGRPIAGHEGFAYSAALKGKGGQWTFEDLDKFLANPKGYAPGTTMAFAGIGNPKERADVLVYLRSLAESPVPLPEATAQPASAPGAPAQGGAPAEQPPSPAAPGQRPQPGPAPIEAKPQPAAPQPQPGAQAQPTPTVPPAGAAPAQPPAPSPAPSPAPAPGEPAAPAQPAPAPAPAQ